MTNSGLLALFCIVMATSAVAPMPVARVTLNEFMAIPDADGVEFIELLVGGNAPLSAHRIAITDATMIWRTLPAEGGLLTPGQFVVVTADTAVFVRKHGALPGNALLLQLRPWPTLNNAGDSLLVAVDGQVADRAGWSAADVVRGISRERIAAVLPGTLSVAWTTSTAPPGTPGFQNASHREDVTAPRVSSVEWAPPGRLVVTVDESVDTKKSGNPVLFPVPAIDGLNALELHCETPGARVCSMLHASMNTAWLTHITANGTGVRWPDVDIHGLVDLWGNSAPPTRVPVHVPPGPGDLAISEIRTRGQPDFVELVAEAPWPLTLRNTLLSTSRSVHALAGDGNTLLLEPNAVHVVAVDLLASGETIVLREPLLEGMTGFPAQTGITVDSAVVHPDMEDARFRSHQNRSLRRVGGAARDWASSLSPPSTPGTDPDRDLRRRAAPPNPKSDLPALVLTEVMYHPLQDAHDNQTDQTTFLEFTNQTREVVHMFGSRLLYETNERNERDTLRTGYQPLVVHPDSSILFVRIPDYVVDNQLEENTSTRAFLAEIWPNTPRTTLIQPIRASLGLRNSGRELTLVDREGQILSYDTYSPDAHHPMVAVTRGRSLERRRLTAGWSQLQTSVHALGATPGQVIGISVPGTGPNEDRGPAGPSAHAEPKSFYPDHPNLGALTHVVVRIPTEMGPRVATITVFSRHGHLVRRLADAHPVSGTATYIWDGLDDSGTIVPAGIHFILVRLGDTPTWHQRLPVAVLRR